MAASVLDESLDSMVKRLGHARGYSAYFAVHGSLPDQKFPGQHHEVVGLNDLDEDVEHWIKLNCTR